MEGWEKVSNLICFDDIYLSDLNNKNIMFFWGLLKIQVKGIGLKSDPVIVWVIRLNGIVNNLIKYSESKIISPHKSLLTEIGDSKSDKSAN